MNNIDRTIPLHKFLKPSSVAGKTVIFFSLLVMITAIGKLAIPAENLGIISGGLGTLAVGIYGIDRIRFFSNLKRLHKEKNSNQPLLYVACLLGDVESIKWLLEQGADPNYTGFVLNSYTPLELAAATNKIEAVRLLVDHGANLNLQSSTKRTALHEAVSQNNLKIVTYLLKKDADPNVQDIGKQTPLHKAALSGNEEMIKLLLDFKAKKNIVDQNRRTAYLIAKELQYPIQALLFDTEGQNL